MVEITGGGNTFRTKLNVTSPTLRMFVGIPYSGKSTYQKNSQGTGTFIYSTDQILEDLAKANGVTYGDIFQKGFPVAELIANLNLKKAIADRRNVDWDQTNLTTAVRARKLASFPKEYIKTAYVFRPSMELVIERSLGRPEKVIPMSVISDMNQKFEMPQTDEGFNSVVIV